MEAAAGETLPQELRQRLHQVHRRSRHPEHLHPWEEEEEAVVEEEAAATLPQELHQRLHQGLRRSLHPEHLSPEEEVEAAGEVVAAVAVRFAE